MSAGLLPLLPAFWSHHDCVLPILGSPPWPLMIPSPTMPEFAPETEMSSVAEPHTFVSRVAKRVVPASTHRVTPEGRVKGPVMKALFAPLVVSLTACPEAQPSSAFWI